MELEKLSYLLSVVVFGGSAAFALYKREYKILKKYEWVVLGILAISLPLVVTEAFALRWGAWQYNPAKVLNLHFLGTQIESYAFLPVVCFCVAVATLTYAGREDKLKTKLKKKTKSSRNKRIARRAYSLARR